MCKIALKNVKTGIGHDLAGYQASIYFDGKRIGLVDYDGWGGDPKYHILPKHQDRMDEVEAYATQYLNSTPSFEESERAYYSQYQAPQFVDQIVGNRMNTWGLDYLIDHLVVEYQENKRLKRACKNKILLSLKSDSDNYVVINMPYDKTSQGNQLRQDIRDRYGDDLLEIINERF